MIYNWSDRAGYIAGADGDLQILNMNYAGNYLDCRPVAINDAATRRRETAFWKENNTQPAGCQRLPGGEHDRLQRRHGRATASIPAGTCSGSSNGTAGAWAEADKAAARFAYPSDAPTPPTTRTRG